MSRSVVISLANERGNYWKSLARLEASLKRYWKGDYLLFRSEEEVGAPKHLDNPYAFKVYAFDRARELGYDNVLWVDSSVYAVKDIAPIMNEKYLMQEAGHVVGNWCNDETLKYWDVTREESMLMSMYGNAGLLGLNFKCYESRLFFKLWKQSMLDGMFKGSWDNHRHDMTNGSIIAWYLDMQFYFGNTLLQYAAPEDKPLNDSIYFYAQGL